MGGYWTRTSAEGWYLDAVAQYTRFDKVKTRSVQDIQGETSGWGMAASLEAGKSLPLNESLGVQPQAQLIVQHNDLSDIRDSRRIDIRLGSNDSVVGRIGARLVHKSNGDGAIPPNTTWLRLNAWNEFSGKSSATYQTTTGPLAFGANMGGSWGEVELGMSASLSSRTSVFGSLAYQHSFSGTHREGASLSAGVNTGGMATAGLGLSTQLTPNARLTTRASYANSPKGQSNSGVLANVALDVKW